MSRPVPEKPKDAEDARAKRVGRELLSLNLDKVDGPTLEGLASACCDVMWAAQEKRITRAQQGKDGRQLRR